MSSGQQYLRARFYDPASGTFYRLDPFAGNLTDPQSLHKYLYAHGNPVAFSDPSGNFAEPLLLAGQSGGTTSWVRVITSGLIGAAFAHGDAFLRTMYMTGDLDAATDAARAAAAAGFAMGLAVGMLEGRLTPYIGYAAFSFGLAQSKQAWEAGYTELAVLDFTLAVFSFFTGVYKPLKMPARAPRQPTRFIDGVVVVDRRSNTVLRGTVDLKPTLDRISAGVRHPHRNDGSVFANREGRLPTKPRGFYTEYVHPTPGVSGPGPQRIIVGQGGEMYYTPDHYTTFIPLNP